MKTKSAPTQILPRMERVRPMRPIRLNADDRAHIESLRDELREQIAILGRLTDEGYTPEIHEAFKPFLSGREYQPAGPNRRIGALLDDMAGRFSDDASDHTNEDNSADSKPTTDTATGAAITSDLRAEFLRTLEQDGAGR